MYDPASRVSKAEQTVHDYLDTHLWLPMAAKQNLYYERVIDKQRQVQGIDCILGERVIDLKCRMEGRKETYYTQAVMELGGYDRHGRWMDGWGVSPMMRTTHYAYVTPHHLDGHHIGYHPTSDTLGSCDVVMVSKHDIWAHILAQASLCDIMADVQRLRDMTTTQDTPKIQHQHHDWYLTSSRALDNQPVNLIIPMSILETLTSSRIYHVDKTGYTEERDCPF